MKSIKNTPIGQGRSCETAGDQPRLLITLKQDQNMQAMLFDAISVSGLFTLAMLILLQAVLGFDNLLYISLESKRVEESQQQRVRNLGIGLAIFLRIALLFVVKYAVESFEAPFFSTGLDAESPWLKISLNLESTVVVCGGAFIIYTAIKEIYHMLASHDLHEKDEKPRRSPGAAIFWIMLMNLVFSFDSILSAMALTDNMVTISIAIIVSGFAMMYLSGTVSEFLKRNRMYEVLGLFILFIVGVMLVSEGGHKAHLAFFGNEVEAMNKSTFYFVLAVLVIVDIVQSRYQKKLLAEQALKAKSHA
ncbi:MAG: TerC family protein [Pirellulaceae bacterium]